MLHIDEHFSQDPTHDFHQVKPDRLLLSYLVGLGVKVRSNSATTFDRSQVVPSCIDMELLGTFQQAMKVKSSTITAMRNQIDHRCWITSKKAKIYPARTFECHIGMTLFH